MQPHTAASEDSPIPAWVAGHPHGGRATTHAHLPLMSWVAGKAGKQVPALVSLTLITGTLWPPQLLYLFIDLPVPAPPVLPLYPEDILLIHMAHIVILILLVLLVLPLLLLTLHLHPHLAFDIYHPLTLFLGAQKVVCGCGALRAVALLPRRG